jgi:hypothetical protein
MTDTYNETAGPSFASTDRAPRTMRGPIVDSAAAARTAPRSARPGGLPAHDEPGDVREVTDEERPETGDEQSLIGMVVVDQHQEHVAGERQDQRDQEPHSHGGIDRVDRPCGGKQRHHRRRLREVLERPIRRRDGPPVDGCDAEREPDERPGDSVHAPTT